MSVPRRYECLPSTSAMDIYACGEFWNVRSPSSKTGRLRRDARQMPRSFRAGAFLLPWRHPGSPCSPSSGGAVPAALPCLFLSHANGGFHDIGRQKLPLSRQTSLCAALFRPVTALSQISKAGWKAPFVLAFTSPIPYRSGSLAHSKAAVPMDEAGV